MSARSIKELTRDTLIRTVNRFGISSKYIGTPKSVIRTADWVSAHRGTAGVFFEEIYPEKEIQQGPPITIEPSVHHIFADEYRRIQPRAFVAGIAGGRVWGCNGAVITPDDALIGDISREFGRYGGVFNEDHSIFKQVKLSGVRKIKGKVAVVAAAGSQTFYHWMYDILPRIGLLKKAGLMDEIDHLVVGYSGLKFQQEGLEALGVPAEKIIPSNDHWNFHLQADELIVTSLPARLGTISDWAAGFLRETFMWGDRQERLMAKAASGAAPDGGMRRRLYLSRRKAPSRNLINEAEIAGILERLHFQPFYPEDYSIRETAAIFAAADAVAGVHGSGFANVCFCPPGTKVIDILAPKHLDALYWILAHFTGSHYAYIFGEGERLPAGTDLVRNKIDEDIRLNADDFEKLLSKLIW